MLSFSFHLTLTFKVNICNVTVYKVNVLILSRRICGEIKNNIFEMRHHYIKILYLNAMHLSQCFITHQNPGIAWLTSVRAKTLNNIRFCAWHLSVSSLTVSYLGNRAVNFHTARVPRSLPTWGGLHVVIYSFNTLRSISFL